MAESKSVNPFAFVGTADGDKNDNLKDFTPRADSGDDAPKGSSAQASVGESPSEQSQSNSSKKNSDRSDSTGSEKSPSKPVASLSVPSITNASAEKD